MGKIIKALFKPSLCSFPCVTSWKLSCNLLSVIHNIQQHKEVECKKVQNIFCNLILPSIFCYSPRPDVLANRIIRSFTLHCAALCPCNPRLYKTCKLPIKSVHFLVMYVNKKSIKKNLEGHFGLWRKKRRSNHQKAASHWK